MSLSKATLAANIPLWARGQLSLAGRNRIGSFIATLPEVARKRFAFLDPTQRNVAWSIAPQQVVAELSKFIDHPVVPANVITEMVVPLGHENYPFPYSAYVAKRARDTSESDTPPDYKETVRMFNAVLAVMQDKYGHKLVISSTFRSRKAAQRNHSGLGSAHYCCGSSKGGAVDVYALPRTNATQKKLYDDLKDAARKGLITFSQIILEPSSTGGLVHLGVRGRSTLHHFIAAMNSSGGAKDKINPDSGFVQPVKP